MPTVKRIGDVGYQDISADTPTVKIDTYEATLLTEDTTIQTLQGEALALAGCYVLQNNNFPTEIFAVHPDDFASIWESA